MLTVAFDGPDAVGKSTHAGLIIEQFHSRNIKAQLVPSLNRYLRIVTGLEHLPLRTWRTRYASPAEYATAVLRAHALRQRDIRPKRDTIYVIDRGLLTHYASCICVAEIRGDDLPAKILNAFQQRSDIPGATAAIRIGLMYATTLDASMELFATRYAHADAAYLAYQRLLHKKLILWSQASTFDHVILAGRRTIPDTNDEIMKTLTEHGGPCTCQ
jgi:hypothetical protein